MKAEPPALSCRDDVVVESGDAASKSCLPSLEMRRITAAGGLVLLSNGDQFQPATSSVLLSRGDGFRGEFEGNDFGSIRLVRQQCLPEEYFVYCSLPPEGR